MEGRKLMVIGALALAGLVTIIAFFMSVRSAPSAYTTISSTSTANSTSIYTTTIGQNGSATTVTTTIPENASPAAQRFAGDLARFGNVSAITIIYNATVPGSKLANGGQTILYYLNGNKSFDTTAEVRNYTLPARVYEVGNGYVMCANLPSYTFGVSTVCANGSAVVPNLAGVVPLNASAYSGISYIGVESFNGDTCDMFSANATQGEIGKIFGREAQSAVRVCINTEYGYPDYLGMYGPAGTAELTYSGMFSGVQSADMVQLPSDFSISNVTCIPGFIHMAYTPYSGVSDPNFVIVGAFVNANASGIGIAGFSAGVLYLQNVFSNLTMLGNFINQTDSFVLREMFISQLDNGTYNGYSGQALWNMMQSNYTFSALGYQEGLVSRNLTGAYKAMQTYPVVMRVTDMLYPYGFSMCDLSGCQTVESC